MKEVDDRTEANECIWFPYSIHFWAIRRRKFLGKFVQVGEGQFSWIRFVRYGEEDNIICNEVTREHMKHGTRPQLQGHALQGVWSTLD
jgi:hypothetical protein